MQNLSLKQHINMFLLTYKHNGTTINYKLAFRTIEHLNTINVKEIIAYSKKTLIEMNNLRSTTKNARIISLKTFLKRLAMSTYPKLTRFMI